MTEQPRTPINFLPEVSQGESEIGPISPVILKWGELYLRDRGRAEQWLSRATMDLASRTGDPDFIRLSYLNAAFFCRRVASDWGPELPDKPGMASAYAISTIIAADWKRGADGTWKPGKRLSSHEHEHNPVESGNTWRKRLVKKLRDREKSGAQCELDETMRLILKFIAASKLQFTDP